jgi:hypothetical protein
MAEEGSSRKQQGLQQAASVIFALVAVVPLLIFAFTLHNLGAIRSTQAQLALGLAVAISLLGFWMFRSMLGRMAEVVRALAAAVEQANRARRAATSAATAAAAPAAAAAPRPAAGTAGAPAATARKAESDRSVPGVGNIREIAEVARTMDVLWQREATAHIGKRVQISVANAREPLTGVIAEVSDDGLILEQGDGQTAVAYRRVTAIDRVTGQS